MRSSWYSAPWVHCSAGKVQSGTELSSNVAEHSAYAIECIVRFVHFVHYVQYVECTVARKGEQRIGNMGVYYAD